MRSSYWSSDVCSSDLALGPIRIPELQRPALILDGQNRLVTFAWSMTPYEDEVDPSAPGYDIWRSGKVLVADPHLETVRFVPEAEASKNLLMPENGRASCRERVCQYV